jgi:two-component system, OmpR family, response regulator
MKVLVIEDDPKISQFISGGLTQEGYSIDVSPDGEHGRTLLKSSLYDLVILDLMLPKIDGMSLLKSMRAEGDTTPVLVLSAKLTTEDKVLGLESGADDYLSKPFSFSELVARTNAILRRGARGTNSQTIQFRDLSMDRLARQVFLGKEKIDLQMKEFTLLELFLKNPGRVLSKAYILEQIWNVDFDPQTNVVDVLVCRLRNKIEKKFNQKFIYTIRSAGYVLKDEN